MPTDHHDSNYHDHRDIIGIYYASGYIYETLLQKSWAKSGSEDWLDEQVLKLLGIVRDVPLESVMNDEAVYV